MKVLALKRGQRCGWWTVTKSTTARYVCCRCDCGTEKAVDKFALKAGVSRSCGCRLRSHGQSQTPLNHIWRSMRHRCAGAAGRDGFYSREAIKVAKVWGKFEAFREWAIGHGYKDGDSIARRHKDRGYMPSNCIVVKPGSLRPYPGRIGKRKAPDRNKGRPIGQGSGK